MKKYETFSDELKDFIKDEYLKNYSVTVVMNNINDRFNIKIGRCPITDYLKELNIYEGLNGPNYLKHKVDKNIKIMREKYGVDNWSQTENGGWKTLNSIPYEKFTWNDKLIEYNMKVGKLSKKNIKVKKIPDKCEYTGIQFADIAGKTNPNDPRKRTIDHVVPVLHCFLLGWTIEQAADVSNLRYVLRIVNSIKGNTTQECFEKFIPLIREQFNESN